MTSFTKRRSVNPEESFNKSGSNSNLDEYLDEWDRLAKILGIPSEKIYRQDKIVDLLGPNLSNSEVDFYLSGFEGSCDVDITFGQALDIALGMKS